MPAIINFKICDNAPECDGPIVCPTKAIIWNETKKTLEIDELKCTSCGLCAKACPVDAIKVATSADFEFIKQEFERDTRKTSDLFVDRYGAQSTNKTSLISYAFFQSLINKNDPMVFEIFNSNSTMCLIKSIPIRELFKKNYLYNRIDINEDSNIVKRYNIKELPCLLFFENGQFKEKIEGYFDTNQKEILLEKVKKIGF